jgi:uncharacterized membrane protein
MRAKRSKGAVFMEHVGFGLGFLNFLGSVLFLVVMFGILRRVVFGMFAGGHGGHGGRGVWHLKQAMKQQKKCWQAMKAARRGGWQGGHSGHGEQGQPDGNSDSAVAILRSRLARGEISPEEFEAARRALGGNTSNVGGSSENQGWANGPWQAWINEAGFGDTALTIARERLARGEIGIEEFEAVRRALS